MKIQMKILNKEFYTDGTVMCSTGGEDLIEKTKYKNLPYYATRGSAAIDLVCTQDVRIYPGETKMIPTGIAIWIGTPPPNGGSNLQEVAGLILPRSGLGTKGLVLANTIGVIDEDYQGELVVSAWNRLEKYEDCLEEDMNVNVIHLNAGDRFAQLMFIPIIKTDFEIVEEFNEMTGRHHGGFGSTGNS